jgi:ribonuclease Z
MKQVEAVFLTQIVPETIGGLPGILLTLADLGRQQIAVNGPYGTQQFVSATRHFMR